MIQFDTTEIEIYNGQLIIPIKRENSLKLLSKAKQEKKFIHIEITIPKQKRSLSANALCWVLCQKIAVELSKDGTVVKKEEVYRRAIKELIEPRILSIPNDFIEETKEMWQHRGIGWMCEDLGEDVLYGHTRIALYAGSSKFNTETMSRLLEGLVQEAESLGIEVTSARDRAILLAEWETDRKKDE